MNYSVKDEETIETGSAVGIDLHGVIDTNPELFRLIIKLIRKTLSLREGKHIEVFIISGPPIKQLEEELDNIGYKKGIEYDQVISVVDYLKSKDVYMWVDSDGDWWADNETWWNSKGLICDEFKIITHFDDNERYRKMCDKKGIEFFTIRQIMDLLNDLTSKICKTSLSVEDETITIKLKAT